MGSRAPEWKLADAQHVWSSSVLNPLNRRVRRAVHVGNILVAGYNVLCTVLPENASKQRLRCHHCTQTLNEGLYRSLSPIPLLLLRRNRFWRDAQFVVHDPVALAVLKPCCIKNEVQHAMPMLRKICMHCSQKSLKLVDAFNSPKELHPSCVAHCKVETDVAMVARRVHSSDHI